jgi:hypothetical protein
MGVKGGLAPLGCLPLWGREGVILAIVLSAWWEGFLHSTFLHFLKNGILRKHFSAAVV